MAVTRDGSPVELYAILPEHGEGELFARGIEPPARCSSSAVEWDA